MEKRESIQETVPGTHMDRSEIRNRLVRLLDDNEQLSRDLRKKYDETGDGKLLKRISSVNRDISGICDSLLHIHRVETDFRDELEASEASAKTLQAELDAATEERDNAREEVAVYEKQVDELAQKLGASLAVQNDLEDAQLNLKSADARIDELEKERDAISVDDKRQIRQLQRQLDELRGKLNSAKIECKNLKKELAGYEDAGDPEGVLRQNLADSESKVAKLQDALTEAQEQSAKFEGLHAKAGKERDEAQLNARNEFLNAEKAKKERDEAKAELEKAQQEFLEKLEKEKQHALREIRKLENNLQVARKQTDMRDSEIENWQKKLKDCQKAAEACEADLKRGMTADSVHVGDVEHLTAEDVRQLTKQTEERDAHTKRLRAENSRLEAENRKLNDENHDLDKECRGLRGIQESTDEKLEELKTELAKEKKLSKAHQIICRKLLADRGDDPSALADLLDSTADKAEAERLRELLDECQSSYFANLDNAMQLETADCLIMDLLSEKDDPQRDIKAENAKLQLDLAAAQDNAKRAQSDNNELTKQVKELTEQKDALAGDVEDLTQVNLRVNRECKRLTEANKVLTKERDEAIEFEKAKREMLDKEREAIASLAVKHDALLNENRTLESRVNKAEMLAETARYARDTALDKVDTLTKDVHNLKAALDVARVNQRKELDAQHD